MVTLETYMLDGTVDLTTEAEACRWRLPMLVHRLIELHYDLKDARAFARFIFAVQESIDYGETDLMPWERLTVAQLQRVHAKYSSVNNAV